VLVRAFFSRECTFSTQNNRSECLHEEWRRKSAQFWKRTKFTFLHEDFTLANDSPKSEDILSDANVVIVHGTLFDANTMRHVQRICEACDRGTYFIMVTKALKLYSTNERETNGIIKESIQTLCKRELEMDWGRTAVYIQVRL